MLAIFIKTREGQTIRAFTWTRDAASGIARAMREAKDFGFDAVEAWAEPAA